MKTLILLATLLLTSHTFAEHSYYPQSFQDIVDNGSLKDEELRNEIKRVLRSSHQRHTNQRDTLGCNGGNDCYSNINLGYKGARRHMFGNMELGHLKKDNGKYYVRDVYCHKKFTSLNAGKIGPMTIPNSNVLNCEHTWPQSKFTRSDNRYQKSDLHHLFPTDSKANSTRGNYDFAEFSSGRDAADNCDASQRSSRNGSPKFQPPVEHRGNVARAMFYFAVRYDGKINAAMEAHLKRWHEADPVDEAERQRNEAVYKVQNNRNPFVDYPNLVHNINNL